jgi:hypothetical protein
MNYILIADKQEAKNVKIPKELKDKVKIILLGWGETAAVKKLSKLMLDGMFNKNDRFFNIGYVGSNEFQVGTVVKVGQVFREIPSRTVKEDAVVLDKKSQVKCFSSMNFVEQTEHVGVFDMELYILATMFPKIKSVKIVSDNLNYKEYKQVDIKKSWAEAGRILFNYIGK